MSVHGDMPAIAAYAATSSAYNGLPIGHATFLGGNSGSVVTSSTMDWLESAAHEPMRERRVVNHELAAKGLLAQLSQHPKPEINQPESIPMPQARRIVEIYIADPNENVPLEDALLYTCTPKMTDLTDQELFFEIDIKSILAAHNEKRVKVQDRKVKDRVEMLEAAKVRDLKMVVNTVAQF